MSATTSSNAGSGMGHSKVAAWALWLAIAAAVVLALAGPLFRMDITGLLTSFSILRFTPIAAIGVILIALAGFAESRVLGDGKGSLKAVGAIVLAGIVIAMPLSQKIRATGVPPITTSRSNGIWQKPPCGPPAPTREKSKKHLTI